MSDFRHELANLIPDLRGFARALTAGNRDLADDLVQDTLVRAMRAEVQFAPGTNLRAWLFTILRHVFCSHVGRKRHKVEVYSDDLEMLATVPAPQEGRLEAIAFTRAFGALGPRHREVLILSVIHGYPLEEIAAICGCAVGTVKSRINRARTQLKSMLMDGELPMASAKRGGVSAGRLVAEAEAFASGADEAGVPGASAASPGAAAAGLH